LSERLKEQSRHIENGEYYDEYEILRKQGSLSPSMTKGKPGDMWNLFRAGKTIVAAIDSAYINNKDEFTHLINVARDYQKALSEANLVVPIDGKKGLSFRTIISVLTLCVTAPFFIYGFINNVIPLCITMYISSKTKDPQFISSFRYVISFILFPIFFIVQTALFVCIIKDAQWSLVYFVSLPVSALLMMKWRRLFFSTVQNIKLLITKIFNRQLYHRIRIGLSDIDGFCAKIAVDGNILSNCTL
jgi:hypothetical protein